MPIGYYPDDHPVTALEAQQRGEYIHGVSHCLAYVDEPRRVLDHGLFGSTGRAAPCAVRHDA